MVVGLTFNKVDPNPVFDGISSSDHGSDKLSTCLVLGWTLYRRRFEWEIMIKSINNGIN